MTGENFYKMVTHFVKHTRPLPQNPILLLMDSHESHVATIQHAKDSGTIFDSIDIITPLLT